MITITSLFDAYGLRARLLPTLLVLVPAAAIVAVIYPNIYSTYSRVFGSLGLVAVGLFFFAHVIRARGRTLERRLYADWGGVPTTVWLRHRDNHLDGITKSRYHKFLREHVADLALPSAEEERNEPEAADRTYASSVKWLLEYSRDTKKFPLVFSENVYYGFRRNTLAGKPIALGLLVLLAGLVVWNAYQHHSLTLNELDEDAVAALAIVIASGALWLTMVTQQWVRDGADAYARALLACCEITSSVQNKRRA